VPNYNHKWSLSNAIYSPGIINIDTNWGVPQVLKSH
jgi:hypothetical protein